MGHRLSKIVTRTGDKGTTGLATGDRVAKTHARIRALGDVDELNSQLGVVLTQDLPEPVRKALTRIQHQLFDLGGELSMPGAVVVGEKQLMELERDVLQLNLDLPPLKEFVLPGGNAPAAACHLARAIARRAERSLWMLNEAEPINPISLRFANRLSDLLFVSARVLARADGGKEVSWRRT
ncbi:MAG TPA: cob(I)yrinic acid a,c-diamide adenosyltransferase [Nevskiaceae bacterium]|nr:cob(I)yrinic acid a,c-diamide adenosyltransferase [Nevskiaceae bacterium]